MNQSVRKAFTELLAPLQSSFEVVHHKLVIKSSNSFIALDKPIEQYIQEQRKTKWLEQKPRQRDVSLAKSLNRGKRQEKF